MSVVCYFIGGPLDLTKTVVQNPPAQVYAVHGAGLLFGDVVALSAGAPERHVYRARPIEIHTPDHREHFVYLYQGVEANRA